MTRIVGVAGATLLAVLAALTQAAGAATPQSITTIAGNGTAGATGDGGVAVAAELHNPSGVAVSLTGDLYIADSLNNRVRRVVNPTTIRTDIISTVAGNGVRGFRGDGGPAGSAELNGPSAVAVTSAGDIFIADTGNNRVREVLASGTIKTVAGDGLCNSAPGNGLPAVQASLCAPTGVAVDGSTLYISDAGHSEVRAVNSSGVIRDFAGTGHFGYSGNGGKATLARLGLPFGLAVTANHDVLIADAGDSVVRDVLPSGTIRTFAGTGKFGFSGDGGSATKAMLNAPTGTGVDDMGDVYISDTLNNRLRVVSAAGTISTAAGTGHRGFSGDGGPATKAELAGPAGSVAITGQAIYFADAGNQRIRGVFTGPPPVLPETRWIVVLPISAVLLGGGVYLIRRRRSRRTVLSTT